jgi:hypothetical protein
LFPVGFDQEYRLHGFGRTSRKLPGLKLRKIITSDGVSYWLRPSPEPSVTPTSLS